ncbi:MAG TPA: methyl-accepting chemotaxis protein [Candidatus Competibacteraceae bacterium]|nr:methyl-accepting chemotaxis protein [Candidatus Competibacteraceae bacterium]
MKKYRLSIMLLIPLFFMLYFSITVVVDKLKLASEMAAVEDLVSLTVKAGALIHELQKERGISAGLLGSKGTQFKDRIKEQWSDTDKRITDLKKFLEDFSSQPFGEAFNTILNNALQELQQIKSKRQEINSLNINVKEAIGYYSNLNASFLNLIAYIIKETDHGKIATQAMAYLGFLQSKERSGIERAVLSNTFASHTFSPGMFNYFSEIVAAQNVYMTFFTTLATPDQRAFYQDTMKGRPVDETARLRKIAFEKSNQEIKDVDANYWFEMQTKKIDLLKKVEDRLSSDLIDRARQMGTQAQWNFVLSSLITLIALAVTLVSIRAIKQPLRAVVKTANQIANGDLTNQLDSHFHDEIGQLLQAMQTMQDSLRKTVSEVRVATHTVSTAAAEIAQGSGDLSQRTEEQASALEETASSMEELTSTVKQSADNAGQANQLAEAARTRAEQGGQVVGQAVAAMGEIHTSSRKIADIISVIDEIAFQTNLLALNAAVEAARAGEQGRGFAVVAGEVRKLAQRSADAAKEIKALITDSATKVEDGGRLVEQSGQTLQEIVTAVKKVSDIVAEMAAAAREQATGIEQVNKAILQIDQVTQQNAALVEETAAASQAMGEQAGQLSTLMDFFRLEREVVASSAGASPKLQLPAQSSRSSRSEPRNQSGMKPFAASNWKPATAGSDSQEWEMF